MIHANIIAVMSTIYGVSSCLFRNELKYEMQLRYIIYEQLVQLTPVFYNEVVVLNEIE